jgi:hypothetical protein
MGNEAPSLFESGIWLIPLIILATLVGVYLATRYFQGRAREILDTCAEALRQLKLERRALFSNTQAASPNDPEPYGSRAGALSAQIQQASNQVTQLEKSFKALEERARQPANDRWRAITGAPVLWYQVRNDAATLEQNIEQARLVLGEAARQQQALERIAWEIAMQARDTQSVEKKAGQGLELLRQRSLQGKTFEDACQQMQQLQASMAQIPSAFLHDSRQSVLVQADKAAVIQVYDTIHFARPRLDQIFSQAQNWQRQERQARERVDAMRKALGQAEQTLANSANRVDCTAARQRLDQIKIIARSLEDTQGRMEVENMTQVAQEAERVSLAALELDSQLGRAGEQLQGLEQGFADLQGDLKKLSFQFGVLGTRTRHPIAWGSGTAQLAELNRNANSLGPAGKMRLPEQIEQDLALCQRLNAEQKALATQLVEVEAQHDQLLALLDQDEFKQAAQWLPAASQVAVQVREYSLDNWSRLDATSSLAADLNQLSAEIARLLPESDYQAIPEGELSQRLQDTHKLSEGLQAARKRFDGVQARLAALQSSEKLAQEQMENIQNILGQIAFIVRSNSLLTDLAAQPLSRLQRDVQDFQGVLSQRQHGTVDKKARQAADMAARVEQECSSWLERLTIDTRQAVQTMSELLHDLDDIAPLQDTAFSEARRLLGESQQLGIGAQAGKRHFKLEELLPEAKRRSDYWQKCNAALRALQEVSRPVFNMFEQASQARQETLDTLNALPAPQKNKRAWPPSSVTVESERRSVDDLEAQWQDLGETKQKAIDLVEQLGRLSNRYQSVAARLRQSAVQVEQDRRQITELEEQLNDLTERWRENWRKCSDYPEAGQDIRGLLDSVERDLQSFHQQYQQGTRNYSQVYQALKMLVRKVNAYQVALDDEHAMDSNGNIISRRDARRINAP